MKEPWATDKWHVRYLNFLPEVREGFHFPKEVIISDCTLREGEQQTGVVLSPSDKLRLARELDEIGIRQKVRVFNDQGGCTHVLTRDEGSSGGATPTNTALVEVERRE